MKCSRFEPLTIRRIPGPGGRKRGAALIIVLASLVFLAALTLAFLASVTTELRSSKVYSAGTNAKLLAQTAVNLATAQIDEASRGVDANGQTLAWASQPGMIRTYASDGQPAGYYKLYSWTDMTSSGAYDATAPTNAVPANWSSLRAVFTDLNQPFRIPDGATTHTIYPIIDGNNLTPMAAVGNNKTYGTGNVPEITGFHISTNAPVAAGPTANPVPMPVKWLYVLEDGKVVAAEPGASGNLAVIAGASSTNAIVGRIAFWADDETSKVNINTASEGSYWDTPRAYTADEYQLANFQGAQREFQRYPGHPATTSLSAVFPTLTPEDIYALAPRVVGGGSQGGTVKLSFAEDQSLPHGWERLYASVDELAFQPAPGADGSRAQSHPALNAAALERAGFFLTTSSRAPDLNLFNLPRVSIWPITLDPSSGAPTMTPFDRVSAFASTINGRPYYFQRQDATSPGNDLPASKAVSGLGRNRSLLEYLRVLTGKSIPGFGGSFAAKYNTAGPGSGTDRDQILTQIFDYIRSTNLRDSTLGTTWNGHFTRNLATGLSPSSADYKSLPGVGQVVPIEDTVTQTRGFGRFPTVQSAFFQFIGTADNSTNPADTGSGPNLIPRVPPDRTRMEAAFFVQMFDPSQGQVFNKPWYTVEVEGLDSFRWNESEGEGSGWPMGFPGTSRIGRPIPWNMASVNFFGGNHDYRAFIHGRGYNNANRYPLVSGQTGYPGQMPDPPANGTFAFSGGDVTVRIRMADETGGPTGPVLQTITLHFPEAQFPVPQLAPGALTFTSGATTVGPFNYRSFYGNTGRLNADQTMSRIASQDVVRAVVPASGDLRLIAPLANVPSSAYIPHPNYHSTTSRFAYQARSGMGYPFYGSSGGKLVNVNYPGYAAQFTSNTDANGRLDRGINPRDVDVPFSTGVTQVGGLAPDWDNGIANLRDGPYINKADEGDSGFFSGNYQTPYFSFNYTSQDSLPGPTYFSPNRLLPSAAMFGSLPSGVFANRPWQTLHFRPEPAGHPGLGVQVDPGAPAGPPYVTPPDHLLLDLFHMPVVEPYAISEPLSTAGRVNMNFQIVPFTYINRDTGIRAVLKSEKRLAIADSNAGTYKTTGNPGSGPAGATAATRHGVSADAVLAQFRRRFEAGDIFRSASEICTIDLVPTNAPAATIANPTRLNMDAYWSTRRLTGDNSREKAYATIYPRLTTKSNTFTIHYRAQSLQKVPGGDPSVWNEDRDKVIGEFRGAQTIERFIDPNDTAIPDYADPTVTTPISNFYRTRILQAKQFAP
jgi:uncharacterized protein (TIGR02600 family)